MDTKYLCGTVVLPPAGGDEFQTPLSTGIRQDPLPPVIILLQSLCKSPGPVAVLASLKFEDNRIADVVTEG
jgi:hypothetical protein